jgi:hypothetical protein
MTIQAMTGPRLASTRDLTCLDAHARATAPAAIVAEEGSELASQLRSTGWVARSGWRSHAAGRPAIWLVRFESPCSLSIAAAA